MVVMDLSGVNVKSPILSKDGIDEMFKRFNDSSPLNDSESNLAMGLLFRFKYCNVVARCSSAGIVVN